MRLLTEEEIRQAVKKSGAIITGDGIMWDAEKSVAKAQRDLTRKETLKAVGEWMEKQGEFIEGGILPTTEKRSHINHTLDDLDAPEEDGRLTFITDTTIEAFKRGEMPEEVK